MKLFNKYLILKPYEAFGNRAEDIYYALLKCRREKLRLIIIQRKWNLIGKVSFRNANVEVMNIRHPLIFSSSILNILNIYFSIILSILRVSGLIIRKVKSIYGANKSGENFLIKLSEIEIGRQELWGNPTPPFLDNNQKIDWGQEHRLSLNVKFDLRKRLNNVFYELKNKKYICLHVRTGGFFNDEKTSVARNSNIYNYLTSIDMLVNNGYVVVRLGDPKMPKLLHKGVLDYAHHYSRNEYNDILLVEHCDAYIGSLSGPIDLACLFEKRILTVNTLSLSHCTWYSRGSLFIPKKVIKNGKLLTLKEQIDLNIFEISGNGLMDPSVEFIENTKEEIYFATKEFLQNIEIGYEQEIFNLYLKNSLTEYFNNIKIWESSLVDTVEKMRWFARHHTVDGSIAKFWLDKNWS
jgi:putative glycosyltransferase (TIGR04372 family)